jgi:hypothetical protein
MGTRSVRLPLLGERKLSMYPSSSISQVSFLNFLNRDARYRARVRLKRAKKAYIRANRPRCALSSFRGASDLKMARKIDALMRRSRRPILKFREMAAVCRNRKEVCVVDA